MGKRSRPSGGSILRQSSEGWQIAAATAEAGDWRLLNEHGKNDASSIAKAVSEFVVSHELSNGVVLSLGSSSVLAAKFTVSKASEIRDRRVMGYRLEELLPLAAEDFAADYLAVGKEVLGVATPVGDWLPLVSALEKNGLHVQAIVPSAIAAIQSFLESNGDRYEDGSSNFVIWQDGGRLEVFRVGKRISDWRHLKTDAASLSQYFGAVLLRLGGPVRVSLIYVDVELQTSLNNIQECETQVIESDSLSGHARRGAIAALAGKSKPWVDLRRGKLISGDPHRAVRREWQWCQWALALLLLCSTCFFWLRGRQYEGMTVELQEKQGLLYQDMFPETRVPSAVLSRLRSERAKLVGARGDDAAVEQPASALNVLHEMVTGLPEDMRLQAQQLRVEDGKIYLDVNVRTVGDAGELADSLEQNGFSIEPPTTEQFDAKQVSVRITGRLPTQRSEAGQ